MPEKFSVAFFFFNNDSSYWTKLYLGSNQKILSKNSSVIKADSFLMSIFNLNQTWQIVLIENGWIWKFFATFSLNVCIKPLRKTPKLSKMWKYWSLKDAGTNYEKKKPVTIENAGQIWYLFLCNIWTLLPKSFSGEKTGHCDVLPNGFWYFSNIS